MNAEQPIKLVYFGSDPLVTLATLMLDRHEPALPDLSRHAALLPGRQAIPRFRRLLLDRAQQLGHEALLPPFCGTLEAWLEHQSSGTLTQVDDTDRELLLLSALKPYTELRKRFGTWPLVNALLALFDELNANRRLPLTTETELLKALAEGYGTDVEFAPLKAEAGLVHQLWTAWNTHLLSHGLMDRGLHRLAALGQTARLPDPQGHIYIVGIPELTGAESEWVQRLLSEGRITVILHGQPDDNTALGRLFRQLSLVFPADPAPIDPYSAFLTATYRIEPDISTRARHYAATFPASPAYNRLDYFEAADFEQEARAIDLAIRRWRAQGLTDIGFVTQDRKLARRVRALLERADLGLRDAAGWALSTTSAATAVMRWIECVEHDFAQAPLLDLLKSPFASFGLARAELDGLIAGFEREVVRAYNIPAGLERYRNGVESRRPMFERNRSGATDSLLRLIERLAQAAEPLASARHGKPRAPLTHLRALQQSLDRLGLTPGLALDAAGQQLLAVLTQERRAFDELGAPRLSWSEFRQWLTRELERLRFRPPLPDSGIELLGLSDSRCLKFDALVVAGCNRDHLPGALPSSPFFNDGVRARLGLPTRVERLDVPHYDFRRLLEAAPRVLLTRRRDERGEALMPSPWVERLLAFHRLAYGVSLSDAGLSELLAAPETTLYRRDAPLPPPALLPAPRLAPALVPLVYSASAHQRLIDCPYQFYAFDVLGLRPLEPVREDMEKSDYGKRVHRILHAFHRGVPGLAGPWAGGPLNPANRSQAADLLREIAHSVLARAHDARLSARGWRQRWEAFIPLYLDWQEARERHWRVEDAEVDVERTLDIDGRTITLRGRMDRIDRGAAGVSIVDYKTGATPDEQAVATGEQTQLPFYALLLSPQTVSEAGYARLDPEGMEPSVIDGEEVARLAHQCEARLRDLIATLHRDANLPAWGDATTCGYCRFDGVCRREMWGKPPQ